MANHSILLRLTDLANSTNDHRITIVIQQLLEQQGKAQLSADFLTQLCQQWGCTRIELALCCLPIAACYADAPISDFYVGAIAIGQSGNFYFGANQEFNYSAIQQTIHAEQSAIMYAWLAGEQGLSDIVVNYTPCGHCRQFMNELNNASQLNIHLPHKQYATLHSYLPDAFGPKDLNIEKCLFDPQCHHLEFEGGDQLVRSAMNAANQSYAPYSRSISGIALQIGDNIITGRYAENAAFNPSFLPLQSALNYRRLNGLSEMSIQRAVMVEQQHSLSHRNITADLLKQLFDLELEYISI